MSTDHLDRFELLFRAAQMHAPEDRAAFLDAACADDAALRRELDTLLQADAQANAEAFLEGSAPAWSTSYPDAPEEEGNEDMDGRRIGPFVVLRRLGHGGMGDVFLAVREQPFKQYVALKIIRRGMDSREVVARFAVERQILAALNHPNIARLIDGGVTDEGLPYFAMEYVDGRPITAYCDDRRLSLHERLRLFQTVCQAVHYAHQNLVIHRDLKPSNILVTDDGTVKLLDFGIAKLLNPHLSPVDLPVTRAELRLMTPEYASPEQVRGESLTTAADLYALGVLLYELLTGHRPYQVAGRPTHEIISVVCEQEPERPSTRITKTETRRRPNGTDEVITPDTVSATRGMPVERLRRQIRGDLDNITLAALRKEPERRYASAEQLGQDIERYLAGLPVAARPNTAGYRLRKFAGRHRTSVIAAGLVVLSLVGGLAAALWQAREARWERDRARIESQRSQATADFLKDLFRATDPSVAQGDTLTARELLERGTRRLERDLVDQPAVRSDLLLTLSQVYHNLGRIDEALQTAEAAYETRRALYGSDHPAVAEARLYQGRLYRDHGAIDHSVDLLREALALYRRHVSHDAPEIVTAMTALAAALRYQGALGKPEAYLEAGRLHREALAVEQARSTPDPGRLGELLERLAYLERDQGRSAEAETLHREALRLWRTSLSENHPKVANSLINLGAVLADQGHYEQSIALYQQGLAKRRAVQGHDHLDVAIDLAGLGAVFKQKGDYQAAETHLREALVRLRQALPPDNLRVTKVMRDLSEVLMAQARPAEASAMLQELLTLEQSKKNHAYWTASTQRRLGESMTAEGRYEAAEPLLQESYATLRRSHADDEETRAALRSLIALYEAWDKPEQAAHYQRLLNQPAEQY